MKLGPVAENVSPRPPNSDAGVLLFNRCRQVSDVWLLLFKLRLVNNDGLPCDHAGACSKRNDRNSKRAKYNGGRISIDNLILKHPVKRGP